MWRVISIGIIAGVFIGMMAGPTEGAELNIIQREGELWVTVTGKVTLVNMTAVVGEWQEYGLQLSDGEVCILMGELVKELVGLENREVTLTGVLKPQMRCRGKLTRTIEIRSIDKIGESVTTERVKKVVSVVGRLALEKNGQEEWLVLHAQNAETYLITGSLIEKLKNSLLELGQNNLISVTGNQDGSSRLICEQFSQYEYNEKHERELKISAKCIRYYNLGVTQITDAKKSDEEIPSPKRDIEAEKRTIKDLKQQTLIPKPIPIGEIYGKITSVNLKSPIKTIEIDNRDKGSPLKKITLIISPDTRIAKKTGAEEPMALMAEALKTGQEVTAVYSRSEFKAEALFITITKE